MLKTLLLRCYFVVLLLFLCGTGSNYALSKAHSADSTLFFSQWRLGGSVHYGAITPHHSSIAYVVENNISALELSLTAQPSKSNGWGALYRYPRWGASYYYTGLGNQDIYGQAHAMLLFADIPFNSPDKDLQWFYQIGMGPAYLTRTFDVESNPLNMAISSHVNMFIRFRFSARWIINTRNELDAGVSFTHFSNGKLASPNLGLNAAVLGVGYRYALSYQPAVASSSVAKTFVGKKHYFDCILSGGAKGDDQISGKTYLISTLVADYRYAFHRKYSYGLGTDFFYDQTLGPNKEAKTGEEAVEADLWQMGVHGLFNVRYSKLNVVMNLGTYVVYNYYKYARIYTRLGLRYELAPHVLLNFTLKSHYAIADYLEWGVGYRF